jgi:hypothetical protein
MEPTTLNPNFDFVRLTGPIISKRKHVHRNNTATPEKFLSQMFEPTTTETVFIVVKDVVSFGYPVRTEQVWLKKFHCVWRDEMPNSPPTGPGRPGICNITEDDYVSFRQKRTL